MNYSNDKLRRIFNITGGICHLCGRWLWFNSYGQEGWFGAWVVEHGNPRSRGGVSDLRNLKPACISCNRNKGDLTTSEYRQMIDNQPGFPTAFGLLALLAFVAYVKQKNHRTRSG